MILDEELLEQQKEDFLTEYVARVKQDKQLKDYQITRLEIEMIDFINSIDQYKKSLKREEESLKKEKAAAKEATRREREEKKRWRAAFVVTLLGAIAAAIAL